MTQQLAAGIVQSERGAHQNIGLVIGPALFFIMLLLGGAQETMSQGGLENRGGRTVDGSLVGHRSDSGASHSVSSDCHL